MTYPCEYHSWLLAGGRVALVIVWVKMEKHNRMLRRGRKKDILPMKTVFG